MATLSAIHAIEFYPLGSAEAITDSAVSLVNKEILKGGLPVPGGSYDGHMGTTDYAWRCFTCDGKKGICPGHTGSLTLRYPVKNKLYNVTLLKWLNAICFECGSLATSEKPTGPKNKWLSELAKLANPKKKESETHSRAKCPVCGTKKYKVVIKDKNDPTSFSIRKGDRDKDHELLFNHKIYEIVNKISNQTVLAAGKSLNAHPKKFILWTIKISPNTVRPDTRALSGSKASSSDITMMIKNIIDINDSLPTTIPDVIGRDLQNMYGMLDLSFSEMVRDSPTGNNKLRLVTNTGRAPTTLTGQLKTKGGRIRKNLLGKRTEFAIRAVISGAPDCKIDEIKISVSKAMALMVPETVRPYNRTRLEQYFKNRSKTYPGCKEIVDPDTGNRFSVDSLPDDYKLKDGTIVHRHIITGDEIMFNRAPSLWWASLSSHRVVVEGNIKTTRMNLSACTQYNADFDGDSMLISVPTEVKAKVEISHMSNIGNFMISYADSTPITGAVQDTMVAMAEITNENTQIDKWHAMQIMSDIEIEKFPDIKFDKMMTGKELVSLVLPNINVKTTPKIFMKGFSHLVKYSGDQILTEIKNGKLVRGILDKATLGNGQRGSILHIIYNEFGVEKALTTLYSLQRIGHRFLDYFGFTTGIRDIMIKSETADVIEKKIASILLESNELIDKLNRSELVPPIGVSVPDYFENEQMAILEPGDDFVAPIVDGISIRDNKLATMIFTGSKGSLRNMSGINCAIGPIQINGQRVARNFERGRTSPYFLRYDMDPRSLGYISTSYRQGIPIESYPDASYEARQAAITNALSTSISGNQARMCEKNLESESTDNNRKTVKPHYMVQPIYGETGVDPRKKERVQLHTAKLNNEDLEKKYKMTVKILNDYGFDKKEAGIEKLLDAEFAQIKKDRDFYRELSLYIEKSHIGISTFTDLYDSPINIERIIENSKALNPPGSKIKFDPALAIKQVSELISDLPYVYFNNIYKARKGKIPEYIFSAVVLASILLRSSLCTRRLLDHKISNALLDNIIKKVEATYKRALVDPGLAVGIIASQSTTSLLTQFILNSKHRAGASGGTKTNTIDRFQEITGVRPTEDMKNPSMHIFVLPEYEKDEDKVRKIASNIEEMVFNRFVSKTHVFYENFGEFRHPAFKADKKFVDTYFKYNSDDTSRLSKLCIRFELSKTEMFTDQMPLDSIMIAMKRKHPDIVFVNTPESADTLVIRCYLKSALIKKNTEKEFRHLVSKLKSTIIRGIDGIISAGAVSMDQTVVLPDGSIGSEKIYYIETSGSNLAAIIGIKCIDPYRTQTDSLTEFEEVYGIDASRNKIIMELSKIIGGVNHEHFTIFADEMTCSGQITSIQQGGMKARDYSNVTLRLSFQSPIEVISEAANNCLIDKLSGVSGPIIMGAPPKIGTTFNDIIINEKFLQEEADRAVEDFSEI